MAQLVMPVGPNDKLEWLKVSLSSAVSQPVDEVIIYDNSEREDIHRFLSSYKDKITYIRDRRMKKVNMARLRNKMLDLTKDKFVIMMDSDVVIRPDHTREMIAKLSEHPYVWLHYAYSESEMDTPLSKGENNPNLGCAALNVEVIRSVGGFDEKYERDEDVWLYAKLRKMGYSPSTLNGKCLHLNDLHARKTFRSSLIEARRNLWRSKYDLRLVRDGLVDITFLTGYVYFGSYYVLGIASIFLPIISVLYVPVIATGVYYYRGPKRYLLNLLPGLSLVLSVPYAILENLK
ncbi:MAG: glycosyltransferase family A protein [Metallosphaera sp.]